MEYNDQSTRKNTVFPHFEETAKPKRKSTDPKPVPIPQEVKIPPKKSQEQPARLSHKENEALMAQKVE